MGWNGIGAAILLLLASTPSFAQMYKCTDARGVTQYADKPCMDGKGKEVDIRGQPPISGKVMPYREDLQSAERDLQLRQAKRQQESEAEAKSFEARQRRCIALRSDLQRLASVRHPADSVAHDAQIASVNAEIARTCR
jgi:hypothetical protein